MTAHPTTDVRISPKLGPYVKSTVSIPGMTFTENTNVCLRKSVTEGSLPLDVRQPRYNATTEGAVREARDIMDGKVEVEYYCSAAAMFTALDK